MQIDAAKRGAQQVLWLYGKDHNITEVGTMNVFIFWDNEKGGKQSFFFHFRRIMVWWRVIYVVPFFCEILKAALWELFLTYLLYFSPPEKELLTPPLESGLILPGVTRRSILDMARQWVSFTSSIRHSENVYPVSLNDRHMTQVSQRLHYYLTI